MNRRGFIRVAVAGFFAALGTLVPGPRTDRALLGAGALPPPAPVPEPPVVPEYEGSCIRFMGCRVVVDDRLARGCVLIVPPGLLSDELLEDQGEQDIVVVPRTLAKGVCAP